MPRLRADLRRLWHGTATLEVGVRSILFIAALLWVVVLPWRGDAFGVSHGFDTLVILAAWLRVPHVTCGDLELASGELLWWTVSLVLVVVSVLGYRYRSLHWWRAYVHSIYWGFLAAMQFVAAPIAYGPYLFGLFCALATWVAYRAGVRARAGGAG